MTEEECLQFLEINADKFERIETSSVDSLLWVGNNFIQYMPSKVYESQLAAGRLAYMTQDANDL